MIKIWAAAATSAAYTVAIPAIPVFSSCVGRAFATVPSRTDRDGIALNDATVCKAGGIHPIVCREASANIERDKSGSLLGRTLGRVRTGSLIFAVIDPDHTSVSRGSVRYLINRLRPSTSLAQTWETYS